MLLLLGAIWYNLLTLTGHLIFPVRPLQDNLARSFEQLAHYLEAKANLFDPDGGEQDDAALYDLPPGAGQRPAGRHPKPDESLAADPSARRSRPAQQRGAAYITILPPRIFMNAPARRMCSMPPSREKFRYSDVMFRFQRLLSMQSQACQQLARSILLRTPYQHDHARYFARSFERLETALQRLQHNDPQATHIRPLFWLLHNLRAIDAQLATIESEQRLAEPLTQSDHHLSR